MRDPGHGAWRAVRGGVMTLVACGVPLRGHDAFGDLDRGSAIVTVGIVGLGLSLWMVGRQLSFPRLVGLLVTGQVAMHALLGVTLDRRVPGEVWTYHAHLMVPGWLSDLPAAAGVLGRNFLITLLVAAVLYAFESGVWARFRRAALRLVVVPPLPVVLPTPDVPVLRPVRTAPRPAPLFLVSALGLRGPPPCPGA